MKMISDMRSKLYDASEIGVFVFLGWFTGLAIGIIVGAGIGWLIF